MPDAQVLGARRLWLDAEVLRPVCGEPGAHPSGAGGRAAEVPHLGHDRGGGGVDAPLASSDPTKGRTHVRESLSAAFSRDPVCPRVSRWGDFDTRRLRGSPK